MIVMNMQIVLFLENLGSSQDIVYNSEKLPPMNLTH